MKIEDNLDRLYDIIESSDVKSLEVLVMALNSMIKILTDECQEAKMASDVDIERAFIFSLLKRLCEDIDNVKKYLADQSILKN